VVTVLVLAGCSTPAKPTTQQSTGVAATRSPGPQPPFEVRCEDAVQTTDRPPADLEVVLGVVALPTKRVLQLNPSGQRGFLFAKQGLVVRGGQRVMIRGDGVQVGWGSPGTIGAFNEVNHCGIDSQWLAFVGGYYVTKPGCYSLEVSTAGKQHKVMLGLGTRCPPVP
jgi:hypothetical protein